MKTSLAISSLVLAIVASSLVGYIVYSETKKGPGNNRELHQESPSDSTIKLSGGKLLGNIDFKKCSPIEMFGQNPIELGRENYFVLEIGSENSIAGSFHIGNGGDTFQKADTEKTHTSYSAYYEGQIKGTWEPASGSGQGSVTMNIKMDLSNGQSNSSPICPNANSKSSNTCNFTLTKDGKNTKATVRYGVQPNGNPFEFTVE